MNNSEQIRNELIKIRNALTELKNSIMSDYRNYSEPPEAAFIMNAISDLDEAIYLSRDCR